MPPNNHYNILCITGYHEAEEKFGLDVAFSFKGQFGEVPGVIFYPVKDNKGSIGGRFCQKVDKEIASAEAILNPDIVIDIHHANKTGFYSFLNMLNYSRGYKPAPTEYGGLWEIVLIGMPKDLSDYEWYSSFIKEEKDQRILPKARYYPSAHNFEDFITQIGIEAALYSLEDDSDGTSYSKEIEDTAKLTKRIIDSFCLHRNNDKNK